MIFGSLFIRRMKLVQHDTLNAKYQVNSEIEQHMWFYRSHIRALLLFSEDFRRKKWSKKDAKIKVREAATVSHIILLIGFVSLFSKVFFFNFLTLRCTRTVRQFSSFHIGNLRTPESTFPLEFRVPVGCVKSGLVTENIVNSLVQVPYLSLLKIYWEKKDE